jgi:hypothetical protein
MWSTPCCPSGGSASAPALRNTIDLSQGIDGEKYRRFRLRRGKSNAGGIGGAIVREDDVRPDTGIARLRSRASAGHASRAPAGGTAGVRSHADAAHQVHAGAAGVTHLDDHVVRLLQRRAGHGLGRRYASKREQNRNRPCHGIPS